MAGTMFVLMGLMKHGNTQAGKLVLSNALQKTSQVELLQKFQISRGLNFSPQLILLQIGGEYEMKTHYMYPAIVKWMADENVYDIKFPDINNAFTFEDQEENILKSAREVLELCIYDLEDNNETPPTPTNLKDIKLEHDEFVTLVEVWMTPVRDRFENKAIKKTLTVPKWLNDIAVKNDVNFSSVLQAALKEYLGIDRN